MSRLLRFSIICVSPVLFAVYKTSNSAPSKTDHGLSLTLEFFAGTLDQSFSMETSADAPTQGAASMAQAEENAMYFIINNYRVAVHDRANNYPYPYYGGRIVASVPMGEDLTTAMYFGVESETKEGATVSLSSDGLRGSAGHSWSTGKLKSNISFAPGMFMMYRGFGLVAEYDMREFDISVPGGLETEKDNQLMIGFRGESEFFRNDFHVHFVGQATQTLGQKSSSKVTDALAHFSSFLDDDYVKGQEATIPLSKTYSLRTKIQVGLCIKPNQL